MRKYPVALLLFALILLAGGCSRSSIPSAEGGPTAVPAGAAASTAAKPEFPYINTGDVRTKPQLLSGWHSIEQGAWRWTAKEAQALLLTPKESPVNFEMRLYFPDEHLEQAGGPVKVAVSLDGKPFVEETYSKPGAHTILKPVPPGLLANPATKVDIRLNRAVAPTDTDRRELGMVVQGFGFLKQ